MSIRRRPVNLKDGFDSLRIGTYDQLPTLLTEPVESERIQTVPNLTITQALDIITILLKDYQSKHIQGSEDGWYQWFPFAWNDVQIGDEIKNLDTKEIYRVEEIIKTDLKRKKNFVKLYGKAAPKRWHILRLDDKKNNIINIMPAYPDADAKTLSFDEKGYLTSAETDGWKDVITYTIADEQPGSRDKKMFGKYKELTPKIREVVEGKEIYGQWIDSTIRFDFWTLHNLASEKLREWFRDFTNKYRWLIQANGVGQFHWVRSYTDINAARWRAAILHRSALYDMRTEYNVIKDLGTIREIDIGATITRIVEDGTSQTITVTLDNTLQET